jgi:hypothetical protein
MAFPHASILLLALVGGWAFLNLISGERQRRVRELPPAPPPPPESAKAKADASAKAH